jgi:hypothetical protein
MARVGRLNVNELKELYEDGRVGGDRGTSFYHFFSSFSLMDFAMRARGSWQGVEKNRSASSESLSGLRRLRTTFSHFFERSFSSLKKLRKEENGELMS